MINIADDDSKYMCGHIIDGKFNSANLKFKFALKMFIRHVPHYRAYSMSGNFVFTLRQTNSGRYDGGGTKF